MTSPSNMLGTFPTQEAKKKKMWKNIRKRGMLIFLHPRSVHAKKKLYRSLTIASFRRYNVLGS